MDFFWLFMTLSTLSSLVNLTNLDNLPIFVSLTSELNPTPSIIKSNGRIATVSIVNHPLIYSLAISPLYLTSTKSKS